jgi:hypothetical protein
VTPAERLLSSVTSAQWLAMSSEQQAVVYDAIHEVVPPRLMLASTVGHQSQPFPFFIDQQTQLGFFLIFGQRFVMGATDAEIRLEFEVLETRAAHGDEWDQPSPLDGWYVAPAHIVDLAPYFAGEGPLDDPRWVKLGVTRQIGKPLPEDALSALGRIGWRLPSEAELELLRLLSARSTLGRLDSGLCADDWHPNYEGAPERGLPWGSSAQVQRSFDNWSSPGVVVVRRRASDLKQVRPFISLFPDALGYSSDAVAARAAEEPMRAVR